MVRVVLVGQPNVGKSSLFSRLTGVGVISSNYAGTTVEFEESVIKRNGSTVFVRDLPGTYSVSGNSDDENVTLTMLSDPQNDAVVVVADATNLEGSLVFCLEVMELGLPTIIALNKIDSARKRYETDCARLAELLTVPVMPVSAKIAEGVDALADAICTGRAQVPSFRLPYPEFIERFITLVEKELPPARFPTRGRAVKLLEGTKGIVIAAPPDAIDAADEIRESYRQQLKEPLEVAIARFRYAEADSLKRQVQAPTTRKRTKAEIISDLTLEPSTGVPILIGVILAIFVTMIFAGQWVSDAVGAVYAWAIGDTLAGWADGLPTGWSAVVTGLNDSVAAMLSLALGYILVFYLILAVLEDTGYLTRIVVLMDKIMHHFGLHGGSFIPMIVGVGCNVPAILATRSLQSRRERLILCSLIVMAVPCSAQISIILGVTGAFSGLLAALGIFVVLIVLGTVIGLILNHFLPSEPTNLAMELPDLVWPQLKNILVKTWIRIKDFFTIAFPLLVVGSIIIEVLLELNLLDAVVGPFSWLTVGLLGLPAVTIIAFIAGIVRKEMAYAMLVLLAQSEGIQEITSFMTPDQFIVFGLVMAVFMPCLATLSVMWKEMGARDTVAVTLVSMAVAFALGTGANFLLAAF
ncbi:MAG: ferrous iron transport protein B [Methanomethylophilus sp.]